MIYTGHEFPIDAHGKRGEGRGMGGVRPNGVLGER